MSCTFFNTAVLPTGMGLLLKWTGILAESPSYWNNSALKGPKELSDVGKNKEIKLHEKQFIAK